jgi:hypothetical protein
VECKPRTKCSANSYIAETGTATSDTVCLSCDSAKNKILGSAPYQQTCCPITPGNPCLTY